MISESITPQKLLNESTRFRKAIDRYIYGSPHRFLAKFPSGCCKTTSFLLARRLVEQGFGKAKYVWGDRSIDHSSSHGWLQFDNLIVDITADQFESGNPSVTVTFDQSFYLQFKPYNFFGYDSYMHFDASYKTHHDEMYYSIISILE
jgi:hypothetical protein